MPLRCNLVVKIIKSEDALFSLDSSVMLSYVSWQLAVDSYLRIDQSGVILPAQQSI